MPLNCYSVRQARVLRGLTQVEMAKRLGVSRDVYRRIEGNPASATIAQGQAISRITDIPFDHIFFGPDST